MSENENPESKECKEGRDNKDGGGNSTNQPTVKVTVEIQWPGHP
jgi:hypothetical protein